MTSSRDFRHREPERLNAYLLLHQNSEPYGIFLFRGGIWQGSGKDRCISENAGQWILPGTVLDPGEKPEPRVFQAFLEVTGCDLGTLEAPIVITKAHRSASGICTCTYVGIDREEAHRVLEAVDGKISEDQVEVREVALVNGIESALGRLGPVSRRTARPRWLVAAFDALDEDQRQKAQRRFRDPACHFAQCVRALPRDIAFPESDT